MIDDTSTQTRADQPVASSFERYLQDKGKRRSGAGGNYRRNAARELQRFNEWATGERGERVGRRGNRQGMTQPAYCDHLTPDPLRTVNTVSELSLRD